MAAAAKRQDDPAGVVEHDGLHARRLSTPGGAAGPMRDIRLSELARQLTWNEQRATLFHYRTKDKVEVDAVLETADGRVVGIEVKASATVRSEDLAGLRNLQRQAGPRFVAGYVSTPAPRRCRSVTTCPPSPSTPSGTRCPNLRVIHRQS